MCFTMGVHFASKPAPPDSASASSAAPTRVVHHADALEWLAGGPRAGTSVITSLPDLSELPALDLPGWQRWFQAAATACLAAVPPEGVATFFQSDIRRGGRWIDKGQLVAEAAAAAGFQLLAHKIVCRKPAGTRTFGRASFSHMLTFARGLHPPADAYTADVLPDAGFRPGEKAMGVAACVDACRFVLRGTTTRTVLDPFCGFGTVLAVANALGLDAIGVDLSTRMCRKARALVLDAEVSKGAVPA
jgi:hypothetical protein